MDEQYLINNKRNILIDSAHEVIKETNACYAFTQEIFNSKPDNQLKTLTIRRTNIFKQYIYKIYNTLLTDDECLICRDLINKINFHKCKVCVATFHNFRMNKWLNTHLICPMCREPS